MSQVDPQFLIALLFYISAALYLPAVVLVSLHYKDRQIASILLIVAYALVAGLLEINHGLQVAGEIKAGTSSYFLQWGSILVLVLLVLLSQRSFQQKAFNWYWVGFTLLWLALSSTFAFNIYSLPDVIWLSGIRYLPLELIFPSVIIIGWAILVCGIFVNIVRSFSGVRQAMHRNRLSYWWPVLLLVVTNDILFFSFDSGWTNSVRLGVVYLMAYVVIKHDLPDLRMIMRGLLTYIITTLLIVGFYLLGLASMQYLFQTMQTYNPLVLAVWIAVLLALVFTPLLGLVRRMVERWMPIEQYNAGRTLREYSQSISNILDMERLASVAIGLIIEAMEIRRGFLFLVDQEVNEDKNKTYRLQAVRSPGEQTIHPGVLSENSPITRYLLANQRPLLQYDLDLLPTLRKGPPEELRWFNQLETEVYVPIFAKREWIGLLALGVKLSGNRYTENDLVTLSALGNQTAVALENARLVDNLVNLNREIRQAYRALDKANRDLERIDRTKSDFISIASHELRTPLTVMRGYAEMLLENPDLDEGVHSLIDGIRKSTIRMHEIMDSMFDIAQLDARNMELSVETVDVAALIQQACDGLKKSVTDREQSLRVILPPLPTVKADPASLKKVFSHLITNAIKFTPNGGKITVHGQMVAANRSDLPEGGIEIVVSDTGIGVDPSLKDVIFTKFYQPGELNKHSTGKTKFKGSGVGLGLALVKGIVDAHGGRIWVESPGHDEENCPGSNFHVILPVRKQGESATVRIASAVKMKL